MTYDKNKGYHACFATGGFCVAGIARSSSLDKQRGARYKEQGTDRRDRSGQADYSDKERGAP